MIVQNTLGSQDSLVYSSPGSLFGHRGVILPILRNIQQSLKGLSFLKSTVGYFNYLVTCNLCLQILHKLRDFNRLPGVPRESITNTNNSTNIRTNSKSFLGMPIGNRKNWVMKKTGEEKTRDTVPLNI
jgi:hypothetical protein